MNPPSGRRSRDSSSTTRSPTAAVSPGIRSVRPGRNLQIKPFFTGASSNLTLPSLDRRWDADAGIDAKYGIGTSLALDLTVHTDFSQVEADEQQINLTRFSLFFPEKREFFLENQGSFRIGDLSGRTLIPFFSRRIGLSAGGEPIPILGGARLTGRQGDYTLGLLNIQTERFDGRPADNFTTLRTARNFGGSSIGGFYSRPRSVGPLWTQPCRRRRRPPEPADDGFLRVRDAQRDDRRARAARRDAPSFTVTERALFGGRRLYQHLARVSQRSGFISRGDIGLLAWDAARHFRSTRPQSRLRVLSFGTLGERFENSAHTALNSRRAPRLHHDRALRTAAG